MATIQVWRGIGEKFKKILSIDLRENAGFPLTKGMLVKSNKNRRLIKRRRRVCQQSPSQLS
ncbi:hypothetical protein [Pectobacterium actinidiae]|uniref:hypothetical protein n=1 Tax=Pectobacterium actinidiae TaxID=1507808 RepID=UPI000575D126|nr:hypothetical protein [Pectobacterium actinidiae]KHN91429.1 hypothetical protein KKH3_14560 [Pectobacterium actinidiae]